MARPDPFQLSHQKILITGGSAGIGKEIAEECVRREADVYITGRNIERLEKAADTFKDHRTTPILCDQNKLADIKKLADTVPALDGIVLNAGFTKTMPVKYINADSMEELFMVNIKSNILLIQALIKNKKINKGASICFISSVSSNLAQAGNSIYSATKGAVNSFARSVALELAPKGIRVNAILPGFIETEFLQNSPVSEKHLEEHKKNFPLGRFGKPGDIAPLAVYLLSKASEWMTGSLLTIDGGYSIK